MKPYILSLLFLFTINSLYSQVSIDDRNKAVTFINQADAYIKAKAYSQAITKLKTAIKLDSTLRDAFTLINLAFYETGDLKSQIEYLKKAKSIYTDDDEFPYHLGKIYQKENKLEAAIIEYNTAIKFSKINGEDYEIVYDYYANRGICFLKQNLFAKSVADFDYAIKLNDMKGSIYTNRGIALFKMKKKEEACKSWGKALELGQNVEQYLKKYCK
jgi:tetratricopeptide (TPR) repeat protein